MPFNQKPQKFNAKINTVTLGTGDGSTFSPDTVCQRGQIVTFLYRAANAAA